jgi:2-dehydropantoate 2-reductase
MAKQRQASALTVLGPGAVGGLLAGMLARSGAPATVVARERTRARIRESGLTVHSGLLGDWTSWPEVASSVDPGAVVLLTVKAQGLPDAIEALASAGPSCVVPVLNGLHHVAALRAALAGTEVVPAAITVEAVRTAATVVEHRSPFVRIAVPDGHLHDRAVRALARAGVEVGEGGSEVEVLWRKFRFLAPMALLTAFHRCPLGEAIGREPGVTRAVVAEVAAVATAAGMPTGTDDLSAVLESLPPGMRSSLQTDLAAGRDSELEAIGGGLLRAAGEYAVTLPASAEVVRALRERR